MLTPVIQRVCQDIGFVCTPLDSAGTLLKIFLPGGRVHFCIGNNLGLNPEHLEKICIDKAYAQLVLEPAVRFPQTWVYVDPNAPPVYQGFSDFSSWSEIVSDICSIQQDIFNRGESIILKPNSKSRGEHVFAVSNAEQVEQAVAAIFNQQSYQYDHVLLVQEYIEHIAEYRVIVYQNELVFAYEKQVPPQAERLGLVSPLHTPGSRAILLDAEQPAAAARLQALRNFVSPLFATLPITYAGLDILETATGELFLLEINTKPGFRYFIRDQGDEKIRQFLSRVLLDIANG